MPFDMAPQETKVGHFQEFASAIMRGCALRPIQCIESFFEGDTGACALGAMAVGMGFDPSQCDGPFGLERDVEHFLPDSVCHAYQQRYGASIPEDNDKTHLTREQIAARIAAL